MRLCELACYRRNGERAHAVLGTHSVEIEETCQRQYATKPHTGGFCRN